MTRALLPMSLPPALDDLHADLPAGVLTQSFKNACLFMDRFVGALALEIAEELKLHAGEVGPLESVLAERRWSSAGGPALHWLLDTLALYGFAEKHRDRWLLTPSEPAVASSAIEAEAVGALPSAAPAYQVLRIAAAAFSEVLAGTCRGEDALFNPQHLGLWFSYFSNDNPHYYPNNAVCAVALARLAPAGAHILEVGGGAGSAGLAIAAQLAASGKPPASYLFTELQPAFLRRGARSVQAALPAACTFASRILDINRDPAEIGLEDGSLDAVVGVNTLHLAGDLVATLARLGRLLRPGGALVLGEVMRPVHTETVHLELPFALLDSYARVSLDGRFRPRPGFLTAPQWLAAFAAAGFTATALLPAAIQQCAELYPGFYCGAVVGRRP